MKYFSTFSGIGGFEIGIDNAYLVRHEKEQIEGASYQHSADATGEDGSWRQQRPVCVGYSEIDKYATKVYERHFKGVKNYGDITKINAEELPDFECLVGGFPCQAFSIAGKRRGFEDTRGTLFFDLARILQAKQPRIFVFENVKGLLSHDNGNTFRTIIATIDELGYDVQWQVLNSKNHGVPQNRERVIIVGHLRGTSRPEVFPITRADSKDIKQLNTPKHSNDRVYGTDGISPTLNTMQGGNRQPFINYTINSKKKDFRVFDNSGIAPSLQARSDTHKLGNKINIRRLTPVECERLQGFPDNWTALGANDEPISDTQRYKMCGNAVTTNVIEAIFERIVV